MGTDGISVTVMYTGRGFPDIPNDVQFGKVYIRIEGDDDELEKLAEKFKANKAKVLGDIQTKPWGLRDLTLEDFDGVSVARNIVLLMDVSHSS